MRPWPWSALFSLACSAPSTSAIDAASVDAGRDAPAIDAFVSPDAPTGCPVTLASPLSFTLAHGAFPASGHPDVAVHVPAGYDACAPQAAIVYFHGFDNCVLNTIGSVDGACTPGGATRTAHHLIDQLDAAHVNAMLVAVELAYDQSSSDTGALANDGGLAALLDELFDDHLSAMLGRATSRADLDRIVLASHSGGYTAVADSLVHGDVDAHEVVLFDSLYGDIATYEAFTTHQLARFDPTQASPLRFAMVYTDFGSTDANSRALGGEIQSGLAAIHHPEWLLFDDTTATLDDAAFGAPMIVKHSMLTHDGCVQYYFEKFVSGAGFAPLP